MTQQQALERIRQLLALANPSAGTTEEEARTAAVAAARMINEFGIVLGTEARCSAIDRAEVTRLALRVLALEKALAVRRVTSRDPRAKDHDRYGRE
jgi:hypothetical protein